jgi:hypothetical protein
MKITREPVPVSGEASGREYADGDVVLRAGSEEDSLLIMQLTGGRFSHCGICTRPDPGIAVDAYPRPTKGRAVGEVPLDEFFDEEHAAGGGETYRYKGEAERAAEAARHAERQITQDYYFDIRDPVLGRKYQIIENNRLYCSEFVWRCYRDGAGIVLIDPRRFFDLHSALQNEGNARMIADLARGQLARESGRSQAVLAMLANWSPDRKVATRVLTQELGPGHNGRYITPDQLSKSKHLLLRITIPPRMDAAPGDLDDPPVTEGNDQ